MKKSMIVSGMVLAAALSAGSFALGQNLSIGSSPSDERKNWTKQYNSAEADMDNAALRPETSKFVNSADDLSSLLTQAAHDSNLLQAATATILMKCARGHLLTVSGVKDPQAAADASVRFQALQCAQNQRIIELLEKLNAGKK